MGVEDARVTLVVEHSGVEAGAVEDLDVAVDLLYASDGRPEVGAQL